MKSDSLPFLLFTFCIALSSACSKPHNVIISEKTTTGIDGVYYGSTYINYQSADAGGYHQHDTTYVDSYKISSTIDSVYFEHLSRTWRFKLKSTNKYIEWYGTHSNWQFEIKGPDSLIAKYWRYGGFGAYFNQENQTFSGMKQP